MIGEQKNSTLKKHKWKYDILRVNLPLVILSNLSPFLTEMKEQKGK